MLTRTNFTYQVDIFMDALSMYFFVYWLLYLADDHAAANCDVKRFFFFVLENRKTSSDFVKEN